MKVVKTQADNIGQVFGRLGAQQPKGERGCVKLWNLNAYALSRPSGKYFKPTHP